MNKLKELSLGSPVLFAAVFTLAVVAVNELLSLIYSLVPESIAFSLIFEGICIFWPVALVLALGYGFVFRQKGFFTGIRVGLPFYLFNILIILVRIQEISHSSELSWKTPMGIAVGIVMLIGVGIREEVLFRGILINAVGRKYATREKGLCPTVLISSAFFGILHMANMFHGVGFANALIQSIAAFATGTFFCALYLRCGSIWTVALLHSLFNTPGTLDVLMADGGNLAYVINELNLAALVAVPLWLGLTALLLRKSKRQKVLDRLEKLYSVSV